VRWRDSDCRQRSRRFPFENAARAFDEAIAEVAPAARRADTARQGRSGGVYSYATASGTRWRFMYRRTGGTQTTKRGFASERAARDSRRRLIEQVERDEVRHTNETFGAYWARWLARRRPYLEAGTWTGYEIHACSGPSRRVLAAASPTHSAGTQADHMILRVQVNDDVSVEPAARARELLARLARRDFLQTNVGRIRLWVVAEPYPA
jgi:hypothetical protein